MAFESPRGYLAQRWPETALFAILQELSTTALRHKYNVSCSLSSLCMGSPWTYGFRRRRCAQWLPGVLHRPRCINRVGKATSLSCACAKGLRRCHQDSSLEASFGQALSTKASFAVPACRNSGRLFTIARYYPSLQRRSSVQILLPDRLCPAQMRSRRVSKEHA